MDQQFRTEYLTRLTDSAALRDMTYQGLPPFYPPGWFWIGGRIAALTGTPGWEMYKPWAIASITIAVAVALALWWQMIRFEFALIVAAATAAVTLAYSSPEPYSAMITVLLPPVLVLAWSGLRGAPVRRLGRGDRGRDVPRVRRHLLHTAVGLQRVHGGADGGAAGRLAVAAGRQGAADPLLRLTVIAVIAAAIGAITWTPFLLRAAHDPVSNTGSAYHYLPADGAELSFPMLQFTLLGPCACWAPCGWWCGCGHRCAQLPWRSACWPSTCGRCCRC
ncbi:arabinofuranosyltransferase family protein [Mycobacterium xenopi 4042]|uniref:Arabinofuranosyltransferase family protein n=1 Tax=Mycobacterium xenopi 4042 TaxID=1299334 RepID=X7ZKB5_MYCXE|nr:arabinofuranosyltransferase family protein [Mycobacterium xenopi 4042]